MSSIRVISLLRLTYFIQLFKPQEYCARSAEQILLTVNTKIRLDWGNLKSQRDAEEEEVGLGKSWGRGKFTPFAESWASIFPT